MDANSLRDPWQQYLNAINNCEALHKDLAQKTHPMTFTFHGTGQTTTDKIRMEVESMLIHRNSYPTRGFRGYFEIAVGKEKKAVLQDPDGTGDGTVPVSSSTSLDKGAQGPPAPLGTPTEHEPAYKSKAARDFVVRAVSALCKARYEAMRGKKIAP